MLLTILSGALAAVKAVAEISSCNSSVGTGEDCLALMRLTPEASQDLSARHGIF